MPFNSSNVFQRLYNWVTDRDNSVPILAERVNADTDDIVAGINKIMSGEADFIGPLKGVSGTASAPAWSFTDDPNSGFFRVSADKVGIATGGVTRIEFGNLETIIPRDLIVGANSSKALIRLNNDASEINPGVSDPRPSASIGAPPVIDGGYRDGYVGMVMHPDHNANEELAITMKEGGEGGPQWWADDVEYKIWTENNDGAGSGLDADTLDGLQGSDFVKTNNSSTIALTGDMETTYALDASMRTIVVAGGAQIATIPNFSGLVIVNFHGIGQVNLFLCGGGAANNLGFTNGAASYVTGAYDPASAGYSFTNNAGVIQVCSLIAFRTRGTA